MRYPVGFRPSWRAALDAAIEAASMTGLRYRVEAVYAVREFTGQQTFNGWEVWEFAPVDVPDRKLHMGVRV